jgi:benzoylformate decarboxylase
VLAPVAPACEALASLLAQRDGEPPAVDRPTAPEAPRAGEPMAAPHVIAALAERLPPEAIVVEESPSSRRVLLERITARTPLGFFSNGNGALGFGVPGATGLRLALPSRPVVGVIGDGSAMYAIQGLWSAARYGVGVLLIVMSNGGYAIMDAQAHERGGRAPWPGFGAIDIAGIARSLGCPAAKVTSHAELIATLDEVIHGLAERTEPLLLEVVVSP